MTIGMIKVAVNGVGMFSPLGKGEEALPRGKSSLTASTSNTCHLSLQDYGISGELGEKGWRATLLAIAASRMALGGSFSFDKVPDKQTGVIFGTSLLDLGALELYLSTFRRNGPKAMPPWALHYGLPLAHASHVAVSLRLKGICETLNDPLTAGLSAIGMAYRAIALGEERSLLAGGVDSPSSSIFLDPLTEAFFLRSITRPAEGCAVFHLQAEEPGAVATYGKARAYICGYAAALTEGNPERKEALLSRLAAQSFPDGEGADLLLDTSMLPDPIPRTLAAGPALAIGLAISLMHGPIPQYAQKTGLDGTFLRKRGTVHRVIVTAESPSGNCAAIALLSGQEMNETGLFSGSAPLPARKNTYSATCLDSNALNASSKYRKGKQTTVLPGPRPAHARDDLASKAVITGMGVATAIGVGRHNFFKALIGGTSGVVSHVPPGCQGVGPSTAAYIRELSTNPGMQRSRALVLAAAEEALLGAGLKVGSPDSQELHHDPGREGMISLYLGETIPSLEAWMNLEEILQQTENVPNEAVFKNALRDIRESNVSCVSKRFGLSGEAATFASGCTGGLFAIGRAARDVMGGAGSLALAGASDSALFPFAFAVLSRAKLLTTCPDPSMAGRPFDEKRDGEVPGEGSAMFLVEHPEAAAVRGAKQYAIIAGFGAAGEGHHFKYNKPDGEALKNAAQLAIDRARLDASEIDLVIAHASGFKGSDAIEVKALANLFYSQETLPPVISIKGATGQPFSAGGPLQVAAAICVFENGIIPPTVHFEKAEDDDPFNHVPVARKTEFPVQHILVTSYGYGGGKAALVLSACGGSR